jgi:hypothetical protein
MLRKNIITTGFAWLPLACLAAFSAADPRAALDLARTWTPDAGPMLATAQFIAAEAWSVSAQWVTVHYAKTPALIVGLAAVVVVPPLALLSGLIGAMARLALPQHPERLGFVAMPAPHDASPDHPTNMAWPREAWLTGVAGATAIAPPLICRMPRELLSIGRGEDNDLVLDETTVHRTHALIQRTPDTLFLIKDLAGPEGNGIAINGERVTEAHLLDGDHITLGLTTLIFHTRRVGQDTIVAKIAVKMRED